AESADQQNEFEPDGLMWGTVIHAHMRPDDRRPWERALLDRPAIAFGTCKLTLVCAGAAPFVPTYGTRDGSDRILARIQSSDLKSRLVVSERFNHRARRELGAAWYSANPSLAATYRLLVISPTPLFFGILEGGFAYAPEPDQPGEL